MLLLFYYGLKYIYNFSAISMSCIIPTRPSKTAVSVYILLFHQFIDFNSCALNSNLPIFAVLTGKTPSGVNNESAVHLPDGTWNVTNTCFIKSLILNDNGSWYEEVLTVVQYRADVVRVKFRYPENAANYVNHDMKIYVMKIPF